MFRISSTSTSTLISQFPALQESVLPVSDVPADQDPDQAVDVAVGAAVGDAKSHHSSSVLPGKRAIQRFRTDEQHRDHRSNRGGLPPKSLIPNM
jgi:hypothetical protein